MTRKFVKGGASGNVVVHAKREIQTVPCQGSDGQCRNMVRIMTPHVGDILCPTCMKPTSFSLEYDGNKGPCPADG